VKKPLVILGLVVVGVLALAKWEMGSDRNVSEPGLVLDRIWIDQLPSKPKDTANVFVAVTKQSFGVFQSGSQYKGSYEVFNHKASGDELRIVYPQTDDKETVKARAWKCNERGMDYCLELSGSNRGVKRYRSRRGLEIDGSTRPEHLLNRVDSLVRPTN
jgi:hypothetical protein